MKDLEILLAGLLVPALTTARAVAPEHYEQDQNERRSDQELEEGKTATRAHAGGWFDARRFPRNGINGGEPGGIHWQVSLFN
jgi:hypothetical protein